MTSGRVTQKSARDLRVGDLVLGRGCGYSPTGSDGGTVVSRVEASGAVYVWLRESGELDPADLVFNHGDPVTVV